MHPFLNQASTKRGFTTDKDTYECGEKASDDVLKNIRQPIIRKRGIAVDLGPPIRLCHSESHEGDASRETAMRLLLDGREFDFEPQNSQH